MKVRIIIATLGQRDSLSKTLHSISIQNLSNLELVIVAPEKVKDKILKLLLANNLNNSRFELDKNRGLSAAINQGFELEGDFEYFCWINDDDEFTSDSLKRSVDFLNSEPSFSAVIGTLGYKTNKIKMIINNNVSKINLIIAKLGPNIIPQPGSLIRRNAINFKPLLEEHYKYAMDLDMWLKILKNSKIGIIKNQQAIMNWHSDSITVSQRKLASKEAFEIRLKHADSVTRKILVNLLFIPTSLLSNVLSKLN